MEMWLPACSPPPLYTQLLLLLPPRPFREGKGSQRGFTRAIEFKGGVRWV